LGGIWRQGANSWPSHSPAEPGKISADFSSLWCSAAQWSYERRRSMVTLLELDQLSREEIIAKARVLGVSKPELLTRVELADEILALSAPSDESRKNLRGWFGVARDLVANVVEAGLHLPDAAAVIRGEAWVEGKAVTRKPVATVTLAEIYATQRHYARALTMLDEVLRAEPDHEAARELRQEIQRKTAKAPMEPVVEPAGEPGVEPAGEPAADPAPTQDVNLNAVESAEIPGVEFDTDAAFFAFREGQVQLYWELSEASLSRLRARLPDGRLLARVVGVSPSEGRPVRSSQDLVLEGVSGSSAARGFEPNAVVRVACGWQAGALFKPIVVAIELDALALREGRPVTRFTPPAVRLDELAAGQQRAVDVLRAQANV